MGRFPGQFLRRTELIKRSLRPDDKLTRSCLEPRPFQVEQQGIPAVATRVPVASFPVVGWFVDIKTTWISASVSRRSLHGPNDGVAARPPRVGRDRHQYAGGYIRGDPSGRCGRGIREWIRDSLHSALSIGRSCERDGTEGPTGGRCLFSSMSRQTDGIGGSSAGSGAASRDGRSGHATVVVLRVLLAEVSRVIAASLSGSAQNVRRRRSPVDTRKSCSEEKSRRHRSPSPSSSSTSSSPSLATTNDDDDRVGRKVGSHMLAVFECSDDRFAGVLD